jgi:hypothetical protein
VRVEDEARLRSHLVGDGVQAQVAHLGGPTAVGAHHVVVMTGLTDDVGVGAVWQVDPLDEPELLEDLEGAEHRRPSNPEAAPLRLANELKRREVLVAIGEELGDGPTWGGHEVPCPIQGVGPRVCISHDENDTQSLSGRLARSAVGDIPARASVAVGEGQRGIGCSCATLMTPPPGTRTKKRRTPHCSVTSGWTIS